VTDRRRAVTAGVVGALTVFIVGAAGCTDADPVERPTTGTAPTELTVSAAASLTESFEALAERFEADHPGTDVVLTFDSSTALADQILEGAPVDVFASADTANPTRLAEAGLTDGEAVAIARNRLAMVVPAGNPAGVDDLADLATLEGTVALCAEEVPCGKLAATVLDAAGVTVAADRVTRGQNARATLAAVADGDAVAGLVYVTDAAVADDLLDVVPIESVPDATTELQVVALRDAPAGALAAELVELIVGPVGQAELRRAGFLSPR